MAVGHGRRAQLLAAERLQTTPTLRLRGGRSVLWLVHVVVRAVHSEVHGLRLVCGSCNRRRLIFVSARACGLWCLIDWSSVGSAVLAVEVSFACAPRKVRFRFGEPRGLVCRRCLRCAG